MWKHPKRSFIQLWVFPLKVTEKVEKLGADNAAGVVIVSPSFIKKKRHVLAVQVSSWGRWMDSTTKSSVKHKESNLRAWWHLGAPGLAPSNTIRTNPWSFRCSPSTYTVITVMPSFFCHLSALLVCWVLRGQGPLVHQLLLGYHFNLLQL